MVTMQDIERGVAAYLDSELMGVLPSESIEKWAIGTVAAIYVKKKMKELEALLSSPIAKELEIVKDDGSIDLDLIRDEFKSRMPDTGVVYDKGIAGKMFGSLRFKSEDIDKLYSYITNKEA